MDTPMTSIDAAIHFHYLISDFCWDSSPSSLLEKSINSMAYKSLDCGSDILSQLTARQIIEGLLTTLDIRRLFVLQLLVGSRGTVL